MKTSAVAFLLTFLLASASCGGGGGSNQSTASLTNAATLATNFVQNAFNIVISSEAVGQ